MSRIGLSSQPSSAARARAAVTHLRTVASVRSTCGSIHLIGRPGGAGRRVEIRHQYVGTAFGPSDVVELARRAGLEALDLDDSETVSWRGGDPDTW